MDSRLLADADGYHKLLADHYSKEELDRIFTPPKPKIQGLVDLIEKAKKVKRREK